MDKPDLQVGSSVSSGGYLSPVGAHLSRRRDAFSLIELLVVIAVLGILFGIFAVAVDRVRTRAAAVQTTATLRSLAQGVILYTHEHQGNFPRSLHSAGAHRESGWSVSIAPYLGVGSIESMEAWEDAFNRHYRSPFDDPNTLPRPSTAYFSFGLNVHFELDPSGDDYTGSPQTWRRIANVPAPQNTILIAEARLTAGSPTQWADHFMSHLWSGLGAAQNAVASDRMSDGSFYAFVDGSVRVLSVSATFDPTAGINLWNPLLATQ